MKLKNKKTQSMLILGLLLLGITVGYAILSTNLNINGTSTINKPTWDIHFENIVVKSGSVTPGTAAHIINNTTVEYAVTFDTPGQFYEFNVDVKNAGTIDGMIESVTSTVNGQPISSLPSYVEYYVTYEDGVEIEANHLLAAGDKETYTVHIGFKRDVDPEDLPNTSETYNLSFGFIDIQSNNRSIPRPIRQNIYMSVGSYNEGMDISDLIGGEYSSIKYSVNDVSGEASTFTYLKGVAVGNIIEKLYVGLFYNGHEYYLNGDLGIASYEENKIILKDIFGEDSCVEQNDPVTGYDGWRITCTDPSLNLTAGSFDAGGAFVHFGGQYGGWICDRQTSSEYYYCGTD